MTRTCFPNFDDGTEGLYLNDQPIVTVGKDYGGKTVTGVGHNALLQSINDAGDIAANIALDGLSAIVTADEVVVQIGDAFDASGATFTSISGTQMNDLGMFAFLGALSDGRRGLFTAAPAAALPAPASGALLALALVLTGGTRGREFRGHRT